MSARCARVGASVEQGGNRLGVTVFRSDMQGSPSIAVRRVWIGASVEQGGDRLGVTIARSDMQRNWTISHRSSSVFVEGFGFAHQH